MTSLITFVISSLTLALGIDEKDDVYFNKTIFGGRKEKTNKNQEKDRFTI